VRSTDGRAPLAQFLRGGELAALQQRDGEGMLRHHHVRAVLLAERRVAGGGVRDKTGYPVGLLAIGGDDRQTGH